MAFLLGAATLPLSAQARTYENVEFQFQLTTKLQMCLPSPPEHPHGLHLLLRARDKDCEARDVPMIGVFATYNAMEYPSLDVARDSSCKIQPREAVRGTAPKALKIDGPPSRVCRINRNDGRVLVIVVTAIGEDTIVPKTGEEPRIFLTFHLETTPSRFMSDLRAFRQLLAATHLLKRDRESTDMVRLRD